MEVDGGPAAEGPREAQIALNILSTIRAAQMGNGLKHGDYGRYRWGPAAGGEGEEAAAYAGGRGRGARRCDAALRGAPPSEAAVRRLTPPPPPPPHTHTPQGVLRAPPALAV